MRRFVVAVCERVTEVCWLAAIAGVPLLFDPAAPQPFQPIKAGLLRRMAEIALPFLLLRLLLVRPTGRPRLLTIGAALTFGAAELAARLSPFGYDAAWQGSYVRQEGLSTIVAYVALFLAVAAIGGPAHHRRIITASIVSATLVAAYGLAQFSGWTIVFTDTAHAGNTGLFLFEAGRVDSSIGNSQAVASYLLLVAPFIVARVWPLRWTSLAYLPSLAICLATLEVSHERGPLLGCGVAAAAALLIAGRRKLAGGLLAVLVVAGAFAVVARPLTTETRFLIWQQASATLAHTPIAGFGPDTQLPAMAPYRPQALDGPEGVGSVADRAHNELLDALLTAGLAGAAAYLMVWGGAVAAVRKLAAVSPAAAAPLGGALAGHFADAQVGVMPIAVHLQTWILLAMAAGGLMQARRLA